MEANVAERPRAAMLNDDGLQATLLLHSNPYLNTTCMEPERIQHRNFKEPGRDQNGTKMKLKKNSILRDQNLNGA